MLALRSYTPIDAALSSTVPAFLSFSQKSQAQETNEKRANVIKAFESPGNVHRERRRPE